MQSIRINTCDKLAKDTEGAFLYTDSYGDTTEVSAQAIYSWLANEQIELTQELEAFIDEQS
jgi:hypothetical protein